MVTDEERLADARNIARRYGYGRYRMMHSRAFQYFERTGKIGPTLRFWAELNEPNKNDFPLDLAALITYVIGH
jgi:hypothetical protein